MDKTKLTQEQIACINCQACCRWLTFTVSVHKSGAADLKEYYIAKGCTIKEESEVNVDSPVRLPILSQVELVVMVPQVCDQLTPWGCKMYEIRPKLCRLYDGRKDPLLKNMCKLNRLKGEENG